MNVAAYSVETVERKDDQYESLRNLKVALIIYFRILFTHTHGEYEENHTIAHSE
jgi:hypothetical protein